MLSDAKEREIITADAYCKGNAYWPQHFVCCSQQADFTVRILQCSMLAFDSGLLIHRANGPPPTRCIFLKVSVTFDSTLNGSSSLMIVLT